MNLSDYDLNDLFLAAIRSEMDSKDVYEKIASRVNNAFLKEKMLFLAGEEDKHLEFVVALFNKQNPGVVLAIPDISPVPLPEVKIDSEAMPISEVVSQAMGAELAAHDFYKGLAGRFADDENATIKGTLEYFARMEKGHHELLSMEKDNLVNFEDYDQMFPMMHIGP
jgi:rubrerythrin